MEKAKVRVVGSYVSRDSYSAPIDMILNLPIEFTMTEIGNEVYHRYNPDRGSFTIKDVQVLTVFDDKN